MQRQFIGLGVAVVAFVEGLADVIGVLFKVLRQRRKVAVRAVLLALLLGDRGDTEQNIRQPLVGGDHQRHLRPGGLAVRELGEFQIQPGLFLQPSGVGVVLVVGHVGVGDDADVKGDGLVALLDKGQLAVVFALVHDSRRLRLRRVGRFSAAAGGKREQQDRRKQKRNQFFHVSSLQ